MLSINHISQWFHHIDVLYILSSNLCFVVVVGPIEVEIFSPILISFFFRHFANQDFFLFGIFIFFVIIFFFLNLHFVYCFYHWHLTYCPHRLCHCLRSIVEFDLAKSDNALFSELPVNNSVAFLKVRNTSVSYQSESQWPVGWGLTFS